MSRLSLTALVFFLLSIPACSGQISPNLPQTTDLRVSADSSGRFVLGIWELLFDREACTAEAVPVRLAHGHFNVRKFMENAPCQNCLLLLNFVMHPDQTFNIDVQFTHPFPGMDNFCGFDVRGTAIFNGSYVWPASGLRMSDRSLGDVELLNADGYTTLFNPVDFPEGSNLPILTYSKGKRASFLSQPSTLNAYKVFFTEPQRRLFRSGETDTRNYHIAWPAGTKMRVGYVVDANWEPPVSKPVDDPLTDFGPNANCPEAYDVNVTIGAGMMPGCGFAPYQVDVWDHQGHATVDSVSFEAPDLFSGVITDSDGVDMGGFTRFTGMLPNELEVGEGTYRVLVGVKDVNQDPFLGEMVAYRIAEAKVEMAPIDYEHGWRKHGKTLTNSSCNPHETEFDANLSQVWTHDFGGGVGSTFDCTPVAGESAVYVVADIPYNQKIWALSLETGDPLWSRIIKFQPDVAIYRTTPTVGNCEVYVGGSAVLAYGSEDGDLLWSYEGEDTQYIQGSPVVVDGMVIVWGNNNTLYAFNAFSGGLLWSYTTGAFQGCPNTPVYDSGKLYCGDITGHVFALNASDGDEIWKIQVPAGGPLSRRDIMAQPVLAGGLVWVGSWNCHLYGIDPADGSIERDVPLNNHIPWAGPAFDGTRLYQPTAYYAPYAGSFTPPYEVIAVDLSGSVSWTYVGTGNEAFFSTPAVANGTVFVASDSGKIYMLDPATGNYKGMGSYNLGAPVTGGISILNGRMYVMNSAGRLFCLE